MDKNFYTCPMHPEIRQAKPGQCPECGMKLVLESSIKEHSRWKNYSPLVVVIGLILLTSIAITLRDMQAMSFSLAKSISYFMTGFFLVFAGFKIIDLKGFAEGYSTYDLLAKRWFGYGYIYPFIELFFGLSMILFSDIHWLLWAEIIVMTFSGIGVAIKLAKNEKFQCACLGTFLKVPLTKITLIEDFGMALLAGVMLILML